MPSLSNRSRLLIHRHILSLMCTPALIVLQRCAPGHVAWSHCSHALTASHK